MTEKEATIADEAKTVLTELAVSVGKVVGERDALQAEIAALREKLAAAEASLAERGRMLELTHRVQRSYRAAVAAALAELRAEWVGQIAYYQTRQEEPDYVERLAEIENRLRELNATIAKLDLPEAPAPCTWTPDDDGNYATGCDNMFVILEGTPAENKMAYCCYCGNPIQEQPQ